MLRMYARFMVSAVHFYFIYGYVIEKTNWTTSQTATFTTSLPIDCDGRSNDFTMDFCSNRTPKLYQHPVSQYWYVDCLAKVCMRCDPHNKLLLNEKCQTCMRKNEDECPTKEKKRETKCKDDDCEFCPNSGFGTTRHVTTDHYCACVWHRPFCMACPCGQSFNAKLGCCTPDLRGGRKC